MEQGQYNIPQDAFKWERKEGILRVTCQALIPIRTRRLKKRVTFTSEADLDRETILTQDQLIDATVKVECMKIKRQLFSSIERGSIEIDGNVHEIHKTRVGGITFDHGNCDKLKTGRAKSGRPKKQK